MLNESWCCWETALKSFLWGLFYDYLVISHCNVQSSDVMVCLAVDSREINRKEPLSLSLDSFCIYLPIKGRLHVSHLTFRSISHQVSLMSADVAFIRWLGHVSLPEHICISPLMCTKNKSDVVHSCSTWAIHMHWHNQISSLSLI